MVDPTTLDQTTSDDLQSDGQDLGAGVSTDDVLIEEELLVEEISIDGMCGVY